MLSFQSTQHTSKSNPAWPGAQALRPTLPSDNQKKRQKGAHLCSWWIPYIVSGEDEKKLNFKRLAWNKRIGLFHAIINRQQTVVHFTRLHITRCQISPKVTDLWTSATDRAWRWKHLFAIASYHRRHKSGRSPCSIPCNSNKENNVLGNSSSDMCFWPGFKRWGRLILFHGKRAGIKVSLSSTNSHEHHRVACESLC